MTKPKRRATKSAGAAHDATAIRCSTCGGWRLVGRACTTCNKILGAQRR